MFKATLAFLVLLGSALTQTTPNDLLIPRTVFSTTCNGKTFKNLGLAGYGYVASDFRDSAGDTISIGSSMAIRNWVKKGDIYTGTLYGLPDRGWNTNGTVNYQPRIHVFSINFTVNNDASAARPAQPNLQFKYQRSVFLQGPDGTPATGLDADLTGAASFPGFPDLPVATYVGDGFGGAGDGGRRISIDAEGLYVTGDGDFWVSDEYGPYIYKFDPSGKMTAAIRPPDALIPLRNGTFSFSANSPPRYDPGKVAYPGNPSAGRQNNQGLEGLTFSPDGQTLYALLQSAARQEGGSDATTRRYTRLLQYSLTGGNPTLTNEYVVPLPTFVNAANATRVAAQSEIHYLSSTQFLILSRDSGAGGGLSSSTSLYRHADIFDISSATNVNAATYNAVNGSIASKAGVLNSAITPAQYCSFIDYNNNTQLAKFGLHNGGAFDANLLNEKWESLALEPVRGLTADGSADTNNEYFMFTISDNDFITQNGFIKGGAIPYADGSGANLNNQALVWRIQLPAGSKPYIG